PPLKGRLWIPYGFHKISKIPLTNSLVCYMVNYTSNEPTSQGSDCMNQRLTEEKSIYLQISQMIETDILRGILQEEERVPSTNELAKLYTINPATAAKGINLLVEAGILYKKRGIGRFGQSGATEKIRARRKEEFYRVQLQELLEEAKRLGITRAELIEKIGGEAK